jgi:hypothetical protein
MLPSMANMNSPKRARGFLKEARKRGSKLTRRESLYLDSLEALHKAGVAEKTRKKDHLFALGTVFRE